MGLWVVLMKHMIDVLENCNCQIGYTKYKLDVFRLCFSVSNFLNDNTACDFVLNNELVRLVHMEIIRWIHLIYCCFKAITRFSEYLYFFYRIKLKTSYETDLFELCLHVVYAFTICMLLLLKINNKIEN